MTLICLLFRRYTYSLQRLLMLPLLCSMRLFHFPQLGNEICLGLLLFLSKLLPEMLFAGLLSFLGRLSLISECGRDCFLPLPLKMLTECSIQREFVATVRACNRRLVHADSSTLLISPDQHPNV